MKQYMKFFKEFQKRETCDVHDSRYEKKKHFFFFCFGSSLFDSAVASLIWPHLFSDTRQTWVRVECSNGICKGVTCGDFRNTDQNVTNFDKNVFVHFNVKNEEF